MWKSGVTHHEYQRILAKCLLVINSLYLSEERNFLLAFISWGDGEIETLMRGKGACSFRNKVSKK